MRFLFGGIAQLVEHLHGMQGVSGSNPLTSTTVRLCLHRLEALDTTLCRSVPGFECPWGRHFSNEQPSGLLFCCLKKAALMAARKNKD